MRLPPSAIALSAPRAMSDHNVTGIDGPLARTSGGLHRTPSLGRIEFNRQVAFETGDLALVQNGWTLTTTAGDTVTGVSVEVARRQPDGSWKYVFDSPDGAALLGH